MLDLATAQLYEHFDFVAVVEELMGITQLNLVIVVLDFVAHLDFFDILMMLLFLGFSGSLFLFELKASVVHNAGYGRIGIRLNQKQV